MYVYRCMYVCMYIYTCVCVCVCVIGDRYIYICIYKGERCELHGGDAYIKRCVCVCVCVCVYIYMTDIYIYIYITYIHTYIHSYIHTCIHTYIRTYIYTQVNGTSCAGGTLPEASALRDRTVQTSYLGYGHWNDTSFQVQARAYSLR